MDQDHPQRRASQACKSRTRGQCQVVDEEALLQPGALAGRLLGGVAAGPLLVDLPPGQLRIAALALKLLVGAPQLVQVPPGDRQRFVVCSPAGYRLSWTSSPLLAPVKACLAWLLIAAN